MQRQIDINISSESQPIFESLFVQIDLNSLSEQIPLTLSSKEKKTYSKWKLQENIKYISYLEANEEDFNTEKSRRSEKVFLYMSKVVKTRSKNQCRTHHQKMIKVHKKISNIIHYFRQKKKEMDNLALLKMKKEEKKLNKQKALENIQKQHDLLLQNQINIASTSKEQDQSLLKNCFWEQQF